MIILYIPTVLHCLTIMNWGPCIVLNAQQTSHRASTTRDAVLKRFIFVQEDKVSEASSAALEVKLLKILTELLQLQ